MGEPADETDEAEGQRLLRATTELQAEIDKLVSKHRGEVQDFISSWLQRQEGLAKFLGPAAGDPVLQTPAAHSPYRVASASNDTIAEPSALSPGMVPPAAPLRPLGAPVVPPGLVRPSAMPHRGLAFAWPIGGENGAGEQGAGGGGARVLGGPPRIERNKPQSIVPAFVQQTSSSGKLERLGGSGSGGGGGICSLFSKKESRSSEQERADGEGRFAKSRKLKKKGTTIRANALIQSKRDEALASMNALQRITSSRVFETLTGCLIAANAIFLGTQTQFIALRANENAHQGLPQDMTDPPAYVAVQALFSLAFLAELAMRWCSDGFFEFFRTNEYSWNMFDIVVVTFSTIDLVALVWPLLNEQGLMGNTSILRVMRVVRIVRVARVIRIMRFFRELRMMIFALLGSFKSLCWALMILGMVFFMFGISITTGVVEHLSASQSWGDEGNENLIEWFGTLDRSIISLYMGMSGGRDWGEYYEVLEPLPFQQRYMYLMFISFSNLAVVNIVTGIFVDSAMQSNQSDRDIIVQEEMAEKEAYLESMRTVFEEMDDDNTGCISMEEFEKKLDDERVIAYFNALKLDASDARKLFYLLDFDQSGEIDIDEFLGGCHRLKGESRALDMAIMQYEVGWLSAAIGNLQEYLERVLGASSSDLT